MAMQQPDPLTCALFLIVALTLAGFVHSAWLRLPFSQRFARPLDRGLTWRGHRLLGANKTLRGFVVIVPGAALFFAALAVVLQPLVIDGALWTLSISGYALLGAVAGFGLMAGELPNSFVKRQLGIPPGEAPAGRLATTVCFVVDRLDSIIGMLTAVSLVVATPLLTWIYVLLIGPAVHWSFSVILYGLGVKARPA